MGLKDRFFWLKRRVRILVTRVREVLSSGKSLSIGMVTVAMTLNNLVTFLIQVSAAKKLDVDSFALFSLSMSLITWISVVGDLGFSLSGVRLFNKYTDADVQKSLLGVILLVRLYILILISVLATIFGPGLAALMGGKIGEHLLKATFVSGGLVLVWSYFQLYFQANRFFAHLSLLVIAYSLLRFIGLVVVFLFFDTLLDPLVWLLSTITIPSLFLSLCLLLIKGRPYLVHALRYPKDALSLLPELLSYGKWVALSGITYTAMPFVVQLILVSRSSLKEAAAFAAGMVFAQAFSTLTAALRATLFPQVTAFAEKEAERYLKKISALLPVFAAFMVVAIACILLIQATLLGETYRSALPISLLVSLAFAVSLYISLGTILLHTFMRPDIDGKVDVIRLLGLSVFSYLLAPYFGALGVAVIYTLFSIGGAITKMAWVKSRVMG